MSVARHVLLCQLAPLAVWISALLLICAAVTTPAGWWGVLVGSAIFALLYVVMLEIDTRKVSQARMRGRMRRRSHRTDPWIISISIHNGRPLLSVRRLKVA